MKIIFIVLIIFLSLIIDRCNQIIRNIEDIWKDTEEGIDIEQFSFTTGLIASFLQNLNQIDLNTLSINFKTTTFNYYEMLKEYEELLSPYRSRMNQLFNSVQSRSKLTKLNSRLLYGLNVLWNSHDFERDEALLQANRNKVLKSIGVEEGETLWSTYFKDLDLNQVPWDRFIAAYSSFTKQVLSNDDEVLLKHILDNDKMGVVTPKDFSRFLKCFGSLKKATKEAKHLYSQVWFHNFLSSEEVERLLTEKPVGTFLVRFSRSRYDVLVLEYVEDKGKVRSVPITVDMPNGVRIRDENQSEQQFSNLEELINHFKETLKYPFQFDLLKRNWYCGSVTTKEAEEMLSHNPVGTFMIRLSEEGRSQYVVSYVSKKRIIHIILQKTSNGFIIQNSRDLEDELKWVKSKESNMHHIGNGYRDENGNIIFPSLISFIRENPHLKYNYDYENVPTLKVSMLKGADNETELNGIHELDGVGVSTTKNNITARSIATYPKDSLGYSIVCDQFYVKAIGNRVIFALADGCNWGRGPRRAAQCACKAIIDEVASQEVQMQIRDTLDIKHLLLGSFSIAHEMIVEEFAESGSIATTTLVAGVLFEIDKDQWGVVFATVGDCKVFAYSLEDKEVTDITFGNRRNVSDARDPGGRLGPYIDDNPDLRNLESKFWPLKKGDLLLVVSDGIHDNLDPETLGFIPKELADCPFIPNAAELNLDKYEKWKDLDKSLALHLKNCFMTGKIKEIMGGEEESTELITDLLIDSSYLITKKSREFLEANPTKAEPDDQKEYPGKMDHTTGICIRVGYQYDNDELTTFKIPTCNSFSRATLKREKGSKRTELYNDLFEKSHFSKSSPGSITLKPERNNKPIVNKVDSRRDFIKGKRPLSKGLFEAMFAKRFEILEKHSISKYDPQLTKLIKNSMNDESLEGLVSVSIKKHIDLDEVAKLENIWLPEFSVEVNSKRITFSVGESMATESKESICSKIATETFIQSMSKKHKDIINLKQLVLSIGSSIDEAHDKLVKNNDLGDNRITTLLTGSLYEVLKDKYWLTLVNIGNIKCFSLSNGKVNDLTELITGYDDINSYGYLGYSDIDKPKLKNVEVQFRNFNKGDILIIMTPSTYHLFNPEIGKSPSDFNLHYSDWNEVRDEIKSNLRCKQIENIIKDAKEPDEVNQLLLKYITENIESLKNEEFSTHNKSIHKTCCLAIKLKELSDNNDNQL